MRNFLILNLLLSQGIHCFVRCKIISGKNVQYQPFITFFMQKNQVTEVFFLLLFPKFCKYHQINAKLTSDIILLFGRPFLTEKQT